MAYQVPKTDHPWRRYKDRFEPKPEKKVSIGVKMFVTELSETWDNIEVITTSYGKEGRYLLSELSQDKQAAWLAGLLKKMYGT